MTPLIGPIEAPGLHVMTLNVRRPLPVTWRAADRWTRRRPLLAELLSRERPTLLAAQEVVPAQASVISAALGPTYRRIGAGRTRDRSGRLRGEATPLFFDADRLSLERWSQRALSDRPDDPGSLGWGNPLPRTLVEAVFRDRKTGARFLAIGTHLDVFSARARLRSAAAIRDLIAARGAGIPAVVLGDLNADPGSPPVRSLLADGVLRDAWPAAARHRTPEWGTYAAYRPPRTAKPRIDAVFVGPGVTVDEIAIGGDRVAGGWPSDHLPVQAILRLDDAPRGEEG
ncbi:endonuclease/exonuclease/phosphatase family protein [Microbacterium flavum]|uniref:Endonuclease/exonuclease/phosphatase family protein n=1 Tax=Microbacterium flavum TaxID=415216 RepID=A0ABS5XQ75_9MICO|nr:endonuclease/exonuclease/phosphatase family protein [Microbacterium flavum]MBT8796680.1 endonuclease/exonuclease/phosphatase family protein [Microbacterium flavum]